MTKITRVALALIVAALPACKKTDSKAGAASASASAAAAPPLKPGVDASLLGELENLVKTCKVDDKQSSVSCTKGENRKLINEFVANQRSRIKSVATFAAALSDPSPELRVVGADILNSAFRSPWGPDAKAGSVTAADAEALLTATLALPKPQARKALPAAVHASMLAGTAPALYQALDKTPESDLATIGYRYVMTHGRLEAFKKVQEMAKSTNGAIALAAVESPRNMFNWTQEEQGAICPWAAELLKDERPVMAAKAANVLANCSGEFVDKLLDNGEAALKAKTFTGTTLTAYRDLCAPHQVGKEGSPTTAQCDRVRELLEDATESKTLDEQTRATALASLAYQWPDKTTLKLAQKLAKGPDKSLAEQAKRTAERLEPKSAPAPSAKATDKPGAPKPGAAPKPAAPAAPAPAPAPAE